MPRHKRAFSNRRGVFGNVSSRRPSDNSSNNSNVSALTDVGLPVDVVVTTPQHVGQGLGLDNNKVTPPSASSRKLIDSVVKLKNYHTESVPDSAFITSGSHIVDIELISNALSNFVMCKKCKGTHCVQLHEVANTRVGLATQLTIICTKCKTNERFSNSAITPSGKHEVNLRLVYGLRSISKGYAGGRTLCAVMNLPNPPSKFAPYVKVIGDSLSNVAEKSMIAATNEAIAVNTNKIKTDIRIAGDGSWQRRGHTSLNGVMTVTSADTGKVIDVECMTKFCHGCSKNKTNGKMTAHKVECRRNYVGSSGGMEAAGAVKIFQRSEVSRGVRYTKYLGDGDTKGFQKVVESKPYGNNVKISKLECVGHVQKRLGARLRNLRKTLRGVRLSDKKFLTGKGRLTDAVIDNLQVYYGNAIRNNPNMLDNMKRAVWATYFHKLSTDKNPQHGLCPSGADTWCGFQKAKHTGSVYEHKHSLPEAIMTAIKPTYKALSDPDLLSKCLHGGTQNPNESFNNVIWTRVNKGVFVGLDVLKMGVNDAILAFNDGNIGRVKVLEDMGVSPGVNTTKSLHAMDLERIRKADAAVEFFSREARTKRRNQKRKLEEEDPDNPDYLAGMLG